MDYYYVDDRAQASGDHEVHNEDCHFLPEDRTYLGFFSSCQEAIKEARKKYRQSIGCKTCAKPCHIS